MSLLRAHCSFLNIGVLPPTSPAYVLFQCWALIESFYARCPVIAIGQLNVQEYGEGGKPTVPQYVETLNKSLRKIFSDVKEQLVIEARSSMTRV